ncbi:MAG TPA: carboxyl transferase domain-containing protein [Solirubrobacterales bacterium]|nr:carboxyl transferase domain-containing protein [Solirubrobacterales bacterium]
MPDAQASPPSPTPIRSPSAGVVQELLVGPGERVEPDQLLALVEVMKMETEIRAPGAGTVTGVAVAVGEAVDEGTTICGLAEERHQAAAGGLITDEDGSREPADERPDLAELVERVGRVLDEGRAEAVERRHDQGGRTARENLADLVDEGSFVEYGRLALGAQRARRTEEELIAKTPADGVIGGTARVNGELFGEDGRCAVVSYDYTVLAGTQGATGHFKKDRLFELIERMRLPVVLFAEGGGGRPGDTDYATGSALTARAFALWGRLSGRVPRIAVVAGRCFAGNAALAGTADVIIATESSSLGMGGPAMIEGGGLGSFSPEEVGPIEVQEANGVVDLRVADEAEAVAAAKQLLSYFQGSTGGWTAPDQEGLRDVVPESRRRAYELRELLGILVDEGSLLELRRGFGRTMITAFARLEGRPIGIVANDPAEQAGAITSDGADKAARFMQLCEAFAIPVLSVVDTPGMMVGPAVEETALVRHCSRLFAVGSNLTVPLLALVVGRGYGLGAQAMVGGSFLEPLLTLAWPSAELGPMGIEGAVRLGMRDELAAIENAEDREQRFRDLVGAMRHHFRALNVATYFEIDDVIDPAETRSKLVSTLAAAPSPAPPAGERVRWVDTW